MKCPQSNSSSAGALGPSAPFHVCYIPIIPGFLYNSYFCFSFSFSFFNIFVHSLPLLQLASSACAVTLQMTWWNTPVIPALSRWRQGGHRFKTILSYIVRSCLKKITAQVCFRSHSSDYLLETFLLPRAPLHFLCLVEWSTLSTPPCPPCLYVTLVYHHTDHSNWNFIQKCELCFLHLSSSVTQ